MLFLHEILKFPLCIFENFCAKIRSCIATPKTKEKAHKQAVAIAMSEAEKSKKKKKAMTEAMEQFIDSLKTPKTESFLENVVKRGLKLCFEGLEEPMTVYGHNLQYDPAFPLLDIYPK